MTRCILLTSEHVRNEAKHCAFCLSPAERNNIVYTDSKLSVEENVVGDEQTCISDFMCVYYHIYI